MSHLLYIYNCYVTQFLQKPYFFKFPQLQRSPDQDEARNQLMRANELEELQEEAHAAHHRGDYSTTITVLDRIVEVGASSTTGPRYWAWSWR